MVTRVNSSLPAVNQSRSYITPIIAALAFAALAYLVIQVAKSLMGRVLPVLDPVKLHEEGCDDFQNELPEEAIEKFTLALRCKPDQNLRANILADRAAAYIAIGKTEEAQADYARALQCHPEDAVLAQIYFARGSLFAEGGHHDQAIEDYNEALGAAKADPQMRALIRNQRGCSYTTLERYEDAIVDFNEAYACDPTDQELRVQILAGRASAYLKLDRIEEALQDFQLVLACDLDGHQRFSFQTLFFWCQGAVFTKTNNHEQAIVNYDKALEYNPSDPNLLMLIYYGRGCSKAELENFGDAITDLSKALGYDPQDPKMRASILYRRGCARGCLEEFNLCEVDISAAIACSPNEDRIQLFWTRGMARMGLKRYPEAIQDYSAAMCINLQDEEWKAQLLYYRGIAHVENKNPVGARIDWEAALKGTFTKVGLREQIEAELNPKTAPPTGKVYAVWGWAMSKWNGGSKK